MKCVLEIHQSYDNPGYTFRTNSTIFLEFETMSDAARLADAIRNRMPKEVGDKPNMMTELVIRSMMEEGEDV